MIERNKKLSLAGRMRMVAACPDANASLCAEAADAIERHEAFAQEASNAVFEFYGGYRNARREELSEFIIPAQAAELAAAQTTHAEAYAEGYAAAMVKRDAELAALKAENERLQRSAEYWEADAKRYAANQEYWRIEERSAIVAWMMREEKEYPSTEYNGFVAMIREEIEAGEHLK